MKTFNKFLIVFVTVLFIGGVYSYSSTGVNSGPFVKVAQGSSLESSASGALASTTTPVVTSTGSVSSDTAFLASLMSLNRIKIDTSIFTNKAFMALVNNSVKIDKVDPGRTNPFSPISTVVVASVTPVAKVVTDPATTITDKSVILNGTINSTSGVTDAYFEYGDTTNLSLTTPLVKPSLVGTFIKNVLGLTPKTDYFFRSCAKINGVATCGDVASFTTK